MELEELLSNLTAKLKRLNEFRPLSPQELSNIHRSKKFEHVWSSNKIEGSTIEYNETVSILEYGLTVEGRPVKDILETLDLSEAYDYMEELVLGKVELSEMTIKNLNQIATKLTAKPGQVPGQYRNTVVFPAGAEFNPYPAPYLVRSQMENLITWSKENKEQLHPVQYAAELHQRFVTIHPFIDGNGRTARLLMEFALTSQGYPVTNIQPDAQSRIEYIQALAHSQKTGDMTSFVSLVANYVDKELDERLGVLELNEKNFISNQIKDID
ncbi:MAG: Fic family protein [Lactococcus petauri]